MKILSKKINEVVDDNGDLIGKSAVPQNGSNLETQASKTTDYNLKVGQQPFRYDMLGRFGFTMMPFMEGEGEENQQPELVNDLAELMFERYMGIMKFYYKNPNKLKSDYRKISQQDFKTQSSEGRKIDFEWADKIIKVIEPHFEKAFDAPESLDEEVVIEDILTDKTDIDLSKKSEDKSVRDKKIEKIAGLIGNLEKSDIDQIIKLLERKK